jgi:ubiquinone/menaquinone biosynthesis C-methylase UbiE
MVLGVITMALSLPAPDTCLPFGSMPNPSTAPTPPPKPPQTGSDDYVLGTGEQEIDRLGLQHRVWSAQAHLLWERAGLVPGMTVLDVGCGPGHATMDLAEVVGPDGRVIAVDESALFLKHLNDRVQGRRMFNVERILGDVQRLDQLLPQVNEAVDMAWARWVLCFVPEPEKVVSAVARMLKPGGRFVIQDYFSYETMTLAPRHEAITRVVRAVANSWRARGGDPDVVGRLPRMLRENGFTVEHLDVNQRLARPGTTAWAWPDTFWKSFLPRLVALGHATAEEAAEVERAWAEASEDPDVFMMLPPVFEVVAVRG